MTYRPVIAFLMSDVVGKELFSEIKVFSKSVGIVTFSRELRSGTLNWGAVMSLNGLTLLISSTADWIAELTELTASCISVRTPFSVLVMKVEI